LVVTAKGAEPTPVSSAAKRSTLSIVFGPVSHRGIFLNLDCAISACSARAAAGSRDEGSRATRREDTPEGVYRRRRGDHVLRRLCPARSFPWALFTLIGLLGPNSHGYFAFALTSLLCRTLDEIATGI